MIRIIFTAFILCCSLVVYSQMPTPSNTGELNVPRWAHESQLLFNGKVLVIGGDNGDFQNLQTYNSAELYNPSTGTWTYTGSMSSKRTDFVSAKLPDGNVLAIGGSDNNLDPQSSCEIYNTSTGTWSPVAPMQIVRAKHDAVVLNNGKILVVGGSTDNSCELYDPTTNTWTYTSGNVIARGKGVSLALLKDGRVLATGGNYASTSAEIYDPKLGTWTKVTAALKGERYDHTSIVLNNGNVLIVGTGSFNSTSQLTPEIFNISNNTFSYSSPLKHNVGKSDMVLADNGNVVLYGFGDFFSPGNTKVIQMYDITTSTWMTGTYSNIGTNLYTIHKLMNGKILIIGGSSTTGNGASKLCVLLSQQGFSSCVSPNLNLSVNGQSICYGKDGTISLTGTEADANYQLELASGLTPGNAVNGTGDITLTAPSTILNTGKNIFKVKVQKSGCPAYYLTDTAIVTVTPSSIPVPTVTASGPLAFCSSGNVQLSAPSGYNAYLWSNGATTQSITVNQAAYYTVKVFDVSGCANISSTIQTQIHPATISAGSNESTCISSSAYALSGYSPVGGTWSGTGVSANGTFNPAVAGVGIHTLTYSLCSKTSTKTVTVAPLAAINDFNVTSLKDSICPSASTTIQVANSISGISYRLQVGTTNVGNAVIGNTGTISLPSGNLANTTAFSIVASFSNTCGSAELTKNKTIVVVPNPTSKTVIYSDTICQTGTTWVKIVSSDPLVNYRIFNTSYTNLSFKRGTGDTLLLSGPNTNPIYIQAKNVIGCNTTNVASNLKVTSVALKVNFEIQDSYILNEQINIKNLSNGNKYQWTFDASASYLSSQLTTPPAINYTTEGNKLVKLITQSKYGCKDSITKNTYVYNSVAPTSSGKTCFIDTIPIAPIYTSSYISYGNTDLHIDSHNNSYIAGYSYLTYAEGGNTGGSYSSYLKKISPEGIVLWEKKQHPHNYSPTDKYNSVFISSITTDLNENVYITGSYSNKYLKIDGISSATASDAYIQTFIAKLNSSGIAQWMIYGVRDEEFQCGGTDILYVDDEHIYVSVFRPGKLHFTDGLEQALDHVVSIIQINKDGKYKTSFAAAEKASMGSSLRSMSAFNPNNSAYYNRKIVTPSPKIKLSTDGKIYLAGKLNGTLTFGSYSITPIVDGSVSYIAILDTATGAWQNAFTTHAKTQTTAWNGENKYSDFVPHFTLDASNNIYITDSYNNRDDKRSPAFITLPNNVILGDTSGAYIGKYNSSGTLLWYNHNLHSFPKDIEYFTSTNEVITFGSFTSNYYGHNSQSLPHMAVKSSGKNDTYLSSYNLSGNLNWIEKIGSSGNDLAALLTKNSCGELSILGKLESRGGIKSDSLYYPNGRFYLARFAPNGNCSVVCNNLINIIPKANVYSNQEYKTSLSPFPCNIKFNKDVTGFDATDLIVTNATVTSFTGIGSNYIVYLTAVPNSTVTVQVPAGVASDGVNNNLTSNLFSIVHDVTPPNITISSTSGNYFNTATITVSIIANETISGLTASDLQLTNCFIQSFTGSGKSYSAIIVPITEGSINISIPSGIAIDSVGNLNVASNILTRIYDITTPTVVISTTAPTPTSVNPIPITITFSEPVQSASGIEFDWSGVTCDNLSNPSGDKTTYTAELTCSGSGANRIYFSYGLTKDLAGNGLFTYSSLDFVYDITKPTVSLTSTTTATTAVSPIPVTVTFSEKVFGLSTNSFAVTNGTATNITGSGASYIVYVTPVADGIVSVQLTAGTVQDTVGNTNTASNILNRTFDIGKPQVTVASTVSNPTKTSPIPVTFTFSENVTGFISADIIISNGTISGFTGSGKNYSANITPIIQGSISVKVNAGSAQDAAQNLNTVSNTYYTIFDNIRPTTTITSTSGNPTRDHIIPITITFSEDVTGFTESDLSQLTNVTVSNFTGSGSIYTFDLIPTIEAGYLNFGLNGQNAFDAAGNGNLSANYNPLYQGDDYTGPTATISSSINGTTTRRSIPMTITFSEYTNYSFSQSDIVVTNGTVNNIGGPGDQKTFTFNLNPSSEGPVTVKINANSVIDIALNNNTESNLFSINYVLDNIQPTAIITSSKTSPTLDSPIPITITFSEVINGLDLGDFTITNGTISNLSGTGPIYTANITPLTTGIVSISLIANAVMDIAGNRSTVSNYSITYSDIIKPSASITTTSSNPTTESVIPMFISFSENVTGLSISDFTTVNGTLNNLQGSGSNYTLTLTPLSNGNVSVTLNSETVFDNSSNGNTSAGFSTTYSNLISAVDGSHKSEEIKFYPNPSNGLLQLDNIKSWIGAELTITNMAGAIVHHGSIEENLNMIIDISNLKDGVYYFEVKQEEEIHHQMIILQK